MGCPDALDGFVRGDVEVMISESHLDFFVRRMVQLLVEGRWAFAVRQPLAWCQISNFNA